MVKNPGQIHPSKKHHAIGSALVMGYLAGWCQICGGPFQTCTKSPKSIYDAGAGPLPPGPLLPATRRMEAAGQLDWLLKGVGLPLNDVPVRLGRYDGHNVFYKSAEEVRPLLPRHSSTAHEKPYLSGHPTSRTRSRMFMDKCAVRVVSAMTQV